LQVNMVVHTTGLPEGAWNVRFFVMSPKRIFLPLIAPDGALVLVLRPTTRGVRAVINREPPEAF
jgi:hypothetical protein